MSGMQHHGVTDWLLDSDPALRWQVERDLLDSPSGEPSKWLTMIALRVLRFCDEGVPA